MGLRRGGGRHPDHSAPMPAHWTSRSMYQVRANMSFVWRMYDLTPPLLSTLRQIESRNLLSTDWIQQHAKLLLEVGKAIAENALFLRMVPTRQVVTSFRWSRVFRCLESSLVTRLSHMLSPFVMASVAMVDLLKAKRKTKGLGSDSSATQGGQ